MEQSKACGPTIELDGIEYDVTIRPGESKIAVDDGDGRLELRSNGPSFFEATVRDDRGEGATVDGGNAAFEWERRTTEDGAEINLRWTDERVAFDLGPAIATTTLRGRIERGDPTIYWTGTVEIKGRPVTLCEFSLPTFDDVKRVGADRDEEALVVPDGWGLRIEEPRTRTRPPSFETLYPDAEWAMQFLSLSGGDAAAYVAAHDPAGRPKTFSVDRDERERTIGCAITHLPEGIGEQTETYRLPYEVTTGLVNGDWYDVARRYRRWVLEEARWTDADPVAEREDVPDWFLKRCLWWLLAPRGTDHDRDRDLLESLTEAFPVPTGVHWYSWHRSPFDVDYPDYFPPREGWQDLVAELEAADVRVMPYVNARIADPNSKAWEKRDLEQAAAQAASTRLDPTDRPLAYEEYNDQRMVAMCPSVPEWRETVRDVVARLSDETDASAVYLDQLAAHVSPPCFAPEHDHPPGGGTYGVDGYRALLKACHAATEEVAVTSENNAEPYMDLLAGHLLWNSARSDLVPLFSAVYGEYCLTFGRQYFGGDLDPPSALRSKIAQSFAFGNQLGWIRHRVAQRLLEDKFETTRRYLRRTAEAMDEAGATIVAGERLRDPTVEGVPSKKVEWEPVRNEHSRVRLPEVLTGLWRAPGKEELVLGLTNWSKNDREFNLSFDLPPGFESEPSLDPHESLTSIGDTSRKGRTVSVEASLSACSTGIVTVRPV